MAIDPIKEFEKALKPLHQGNWKEAAKHLEKVLTTDQPELAARARVYLDICEGRQHETSSTGDDYLDALMAKNRGDLEAAASLCAKHQGEIDFTYLGAAVAALRGDIPSAMAGLESVIERDIKYRVHAFHDSDFDGIRESEEFQTIFEQA